MSDEQPLDDLLEEAEEHRETLSTVQQRQQEIKDRLREHVAELDAADEIDEPSADRLRTLIGRGQYGEVRDAIQEARQSSLAFEDEEKALFAERFGDAWDELEANVEQVRTALLSLERRTGRDDLVAYLYGKHSNLRKGDIEAVLDVVDDIGQSSLSTRDMARVIAAFDRDLNVTDAETVIKAIQEEAHGDGA